MDSKLDPETLFLPRLKSCPWLMWSYLWRTREAIERDRR